MNRTIQTSLLLILYSVLFVFAQENEVQLDADPNDSHNQLFHFLSRQNAKFEGKFRTLETLLKQMNELLLSQDKERGNSVAENQNFGANFLKFSSETIESLASMRRQISSLENSLQSVTQSNAELQNKLNIMEASQKDNQLRGSFWKTGKVILYFQTNHRGLTEEVDFLNCSPRPCCKNLTTLSQRSESINTNNTCVKLFYDKDCFGRWDVFHPGSPSSHEDFGSSNNMFRSISTCE